jgi:hypothetical protein
LLPSADGSINNRDGLSDQYLLNSVSPGEEETHVPLL